MRNYKEALIASAFFVFSLQSLFSFADECLPEGSPQNVTVKHVTDGDTVRLTDGRSVRLIGVNTPELYSKPSPEIGALDAKLALKKWVEGKSVVLVEGAEPKDRYGRTLGYLVSEGQTLSQRLVANGLGWAISIPPNDELTDCLFTAEKAAVSQKLGVWSRPITKAEVLVKGGFDVVEGKVTRVDAARKFTYVELGSKLTLRFTNKIAQSLSFSKGQNIVARGWIIDRTKSLKPNSRYTPLLLTISDARHFQIVK